MPRQKGFGTELIRHSFRYFQGKNHIKKDRKFQMFFYDKLSKAVLFFSYPGISSLNLLSQEPTFLSFIHIFVQHKSIIL